MQIFTLLTENSVAHFSQGFKCLLQDMQLRLLPGQQLADRVLVERTADDEQRRARRRHGVDPAAVVGRVELIPDSALLEKALDAQDLAVDRRREERRDARGQRFPPERQVQIRQRLDAQFLRSERFHIIRRAVSAARERGEIRLGQFVPGPGDDRGVPGKLGADGRGRTAQVCDRLGDLLRTGQLRAAEHDGARAGGLRGQEEVLLGARVPVGQRIDDRDDAADLVFAVERRLGERVEKLVHIKDARGLDDDAVVPGHAHFDQPRAKAAAVAVGVTAAGDRLDRAAARRKRTQQRQIDVYGPVVVGQNAELLPLIGEIRGIAQQKGRLPRA